MWANQRKGKFTASEIWKLFVEPKTKADKEAGNWSDTAMTYIFEKAVEEATGWKKEFTAKAMEHGLVNEAEGFEAFVKITGLNFTLSSSTFIKYGENSGASPDGVLYYDIDKIMAVMDIKCPYSPISFFEQKKAHLEGSEYQGVPKPYFYQLQLQMMAAGCKESYLVRYLTSALTDDFGNKFEFDLPLESRIFYTKVLLNDEVKQQIDQKLAKAEETKSLIIKTLM